MDSERQLIFDEDYQGLESELKSMGQPSFRVQQIWKAVYQNFRITPDEITTLPKQLRIDLEKRFTFQALNPSRSIESADGFTVKTLFQLKDGNPVEAVLMYYDDRRTLCISTQSGCGMGCSFCATGHMGLKRNLTSGEIVAQVLYFARILAGRNERVSNIVVMGMGEPFQNYDHLMTAMDRLNDERAFGLGARRITISTVGLVPEIRKFADEGTQINLAVSLHTVNDRLRSELIPINKKYPVDVLINACKYYIQKTNRRISFEIALIKDVNDSIEDAQALASKLRGLLCHVNLIPLNPIGDYSGQPTNKEQVNTYYNVLTDKHIPCTVRLRRGIEIKAGCGQLASEIE